jgi:hypothetical protein
MPRAVPLQTAVYRTFLRQEWRLFEIPRNHNRKMNIIIRDKDNQLKADTIDMVQYLIAQKRKHPPFNSYEEAQERLFSNILNRLEKQLTEKHSVLKNKLPGKPDSYNMQLVSQLVEADTIHNETLQNITAFGKYIVEQEKINTAGKEYQLSFVYKYIPPPNAAVKKSTEQTMFITTYKNF